MLTWLGALGTAIAEYFSRKGFAVLIYGAAFFGLLASFYAAMAFTQSVLGALNHAIQAMPARTGGPSINWLVMIGMFIPSNAINCLLLIVQAWITRAAFLLTMRYIDGVVKSS